MDLSLVKASISQRQDWRLTDEEIISQVRWALFLTVTRDPSAHSEQDDHVGRTRNRIKICWCPIFGCTLLELDPHELSS